MVQVAKLLCTRMKKGRRQVIFSGLYVLQGRFLTLGNELPEGSDMAILPILGKSAHAHVHAALCTQLCRNSSRSLNVEFSPRKEQKIGTKKCLLGWERIKNTPQKGLAKQMVAGPC